MSRTDKDKPWWVRAVWYEPFHDRSCVLHTNTGHYPRFGPERNPCDLPPEPIVSPTATSYQANSCLTRCTWHPDWPDEHSHYRYRYTGRPPSDLFHHNWWGPARAEKRDVLREARKCYRGEGDPGDDEPRGHHRHSPFTGGYWD